MLAKRIYILISLIQKENQCALYNSLEGIFPPNWVVSIGIESDGIWQWFRKEKVIHLEGKLLWGCSLFPNSILKRKKDPFKHYMIILEHTLNTQPSRFLQMPFLLFGISISFISRGPSFSSKTFSRSISFLISCCHPWTPSLCFCHSLSSRSFTYACIL